MVVVTLREKILLNLRKDNIPVGVDDPIAKAGDHRGLHQRHEVSVNRYVTRDRRLVRICCFLSKQVFRDYFFRNYYSETPCVFRTNRFQPKLVTGQFAVISVSEFAEIVPANNRNQLCGLFADRPFRQLLAISINPECGFEIWIVLVLGVAVTLLANLFQEKRSLG